MKVALYGGSFNPPHAGHVLAAAYLTCVADFEKVLVVPVFEHAFDKTLLGYEERVELCRVAFSNLSQVEVCTIESTLPRPSYTISTVEALLERHPHYQLELVVGADVLPELAKWHRIDELLRKTKLFAMGRRGHASSECPSPWLPEVSSSQLRELMRQPRTAKVSERLRELVPTRVLAMIEERGYYR